MEYRLFKIILIIRARLYRLSYNRRFQEHTHLLHMGNRSQHGGLFSSRRDVNYWAIED